MPEQTQTQTYVGFDDISMPLNKGLVTIDNTDPDCPIQGAGLCWDKIEGRHAVTVELAMRGMEPMHFSLRSDAARLHDPRLMSGVIWKWVIPLASGVFASEMPVGAEILSVQTQNSEGVMWARVDPQAPTATRLFRIAVTGGDCPDGSYVGTYQLDAGAFVAHLFEVAT